MNFLSVVAFFTIVAAVQADKTKEETIEAIQHITVVCAAETGAKETDIDAIIKHLPATNMKTKCLRACIMKKLKVMNAEGKFNKNAALKIVKSHTHGNPDKIKIAELVTNACSNIPVPDDHCEAAELYKICLESKAMQYGINKTD